MSTGPGFSRPTSASSGKAIGASDTEGQDCARVRPPAETPRRPSRIASRPSTPVKRPSTPTKPSEPPTGIPISRQGTRKYTLTRKSSGSSLAGTSSPSKFIFPARPSSPAVTNRVTASGHIASSPDSILDDSVLHNEPEFMSTPTFTAAVMDNGRAKPSEESPIVASRKSAQRQVLSDALTSSPSPGVKVEHRLPTGEPVNTNPLHKGPPPPLDPRGATEHAIPEPTQGEDTSGQQGAETPAAASPPAASGQNSTPATQTSQPPDNAGAAVQNDNKAPAGQSGAGGTGQQMSGTTDTGAKPETTATGAALPVTAPAASSANDPPVNTGSQASGMSQPAPPDPAGKATKPGDAPAEASPPAEGSPGTLNSQTPGMQPPAPPAAEKEPKAGDETTAPPAQAPPPAQGQPGTSNTQMSGTGPPAPSQGNKPSDAATAAGVALPVQSSPVTTTTATPGAPTIPGTAKPSPSSAPAAPSLPSPISLLPLPTALALNLPGTDVGRINAVWNKWFNASAGADDYVEPAAHRYDINDELVPDIVIYKSPNPGQSPGWKIVYEGQPGAIVPLPSDENWERARKRMEDICARHTDQSPKWVVLAIGAWARIYAFGPMGLAGMMYQNGVIVPSLPPGPIPWKPDPDPNTVTCVSLSIGDIPGFPYVAALQAAFTKIFS